MYINISGPRALELGGTLTKTPVGNRSYGSTNQRNYESTCDMDFLFHIPQKSDPRQGYSHDAEAHATIVTVRAEASKALGSPIWIEPPSFHISDHTGWIGMKIHISKWNM